MRKKAIVSIGAVAIVGALALFGCASGNASQPSQPSSSGTADAAPAAATTATASGDLNEMEQWGQKYPNEYASMFKDVSAEDKMDDHSHAGRLKWICEIPTPRTGAGTMIRDENGRLAVDNVYYDEETGQWCVEKPANGDYGQYGLTVGCYKCKTEIYNDFVEEYGEDAGKMPITDETIAKVDNQYWNCAACHEGDPGEKNLGPQIAGFSDGPYKDLLQGVDARVTVCVQCHNASSGTGLEPEEAFEGRKPTTDPKTGLEVKKVFHPDVEMVLSSNHYSLGNDCVDCHMPQETAADGTTFTDHAASQKVTENETALQYCLSCHEAQGIKSTSEMKALVQSLQKECGDKTRAIKQRQEALGQAIVAARDAGTLAGADLDTALENYKMIYFYRSWLWDDNENDLDPGTKAPMNPDQTRDVIARAEKLLDETEPLVK